MVKPRRLLLLILLLAFGLRLYLLTEIPPGLTHDEANHGREGIEILDGIYRYFFPLNYGSEPIYSYTVAASMRLFGENLFALRYVNVVFGVLAIAATYVWATWAFNRRAGLLTAVLLALSFWPLASSRQALRAGMLPFFTACTVLVFWWVLGLAPRYKWQPSSSTRTQVGLLFFVLGILATFHIYLAARVAWLIFPAFLLYTAFLHRQIFNKHWQKIIGALVLASLLLIPMFLYLQNRPESQTRLGMLDGTLDAVQNGNFQPVLQTVSEALLAFVWPGFGDQFLAYNIPGRPVFDALTAVFFVLGLGVCLWRWKRPSYTFLLLWFFVGILPSLLTGATANTTRNLAALPAVFILPAIGFTHIATGLRNRAPTMARVIPVVISLWLLFVGLTTSRDYFNRWAQSPDVRGAYQRNLGEAIAYWQAVGGESPIIFSSVYPGPAHDTSIATILFDNTPLDRRWIDARQALVLPDQRPLSFLIPASTPLHPAFQPLLDAVETISLRSSDLDPSFTHYRFNEQKPSWLQTDQTVATVDGAIDLLHGQWLADATPPGGVAEMLTVWRVADPARIGPTVPPAYTTDVVLFTHVLDDAGNIVVQQDRLDAPSWSWQTDDLLIQIHSMWLAPETAVGTYPTITGFYDRASGERRPIITPSGEVTGTHIELPPLVVGN